MWCLLPCFWEPMKLLGLRLSSGIAVEDNRSNKYPQQQSRTLSLLLLACEVLCTNIWNSSFVFGFTVKIISIIIFTIAYVEFIITKLPCVSYCSNLKFLTDIFRGIPMGKSGYTCVRYIFCYLNITLWVSRPKRL